MYENTRHDYGYMGYLIYQHIKCQSFQNEDYTPTTLSYNQITSNTFKDMSFYIIILFFIIFQPNHKMCFFSKWVNRIKQFISYRPWQRPW